MARRPAGWKSPSAAATDLDLAVKVRDAIGLCVDPAHAVMLSGRREERTLAPCSTQG